MPFSNCFRGFANWRYRKYSARLEDADTETRRLAAFTLFYLFDYTAFLSERNMLLDGWTTENGLHAIFAAGANLECLLRREKDECVCHTLLDIVNLYEKAKPFYLTQVLKLPESPKSKAKHTFFEEFNDESAETEADLIDWRGPGGRLHRNKAEGRLPRKRQIKKNKHAITLVANKNRRLR